MKANQQHLDSLGEKLDTLDLTNEERGALELSFALASQTVAEASENEVSGFAFKPRSLGAFKPASFPTRTEFANLDVNFDSDKGLDYDFDIDFL